MESQELPDDMEDKKLSAVREVAGFPPSAQELLDGTKLKGEEDVAGDDNSPPVQKDKVGQEQIHDLLFSKKLSWQAIIYDLINTEQLDPWNIDISLLARKYLEKVRELEEADFFVSSKVLFAASLLLRIKSDILLNHEIPSLDDILFARDKKVGHSQERIELDEDVPELVPRTPLPRSKRVTLQELLSALGKAIKTENRRIKKEVVLKQRLKEAEIVLPRNVFNIREKIRDIYRSLKEAFSKRDERLAFSELLDMTKEDKIVAFVSLLHLDNQQKIWLEQENRFDEIWILLKKMYEEQNKEKLAKLKAEVDALELEMESEISEEEIAEQLKKGSVADEELPENVRDTKVDTGFSNEIEKELE